MIYMTEQTYKQLRDDDAGLCRACWTVNYGVEPDARKYQCESCDKPQVYGIDEYLIAGLISFQEGQEDAPFVKLKSKATGEIYSKVIEF